MQTLLMLQNMKGMVLNLRRQLPAVPGKRLKQEGGWLQSRKTRFCTKLLHVCRTEVLAVSPFIALHVQQGVSVIDEVGSVGTEGHVLSLAVTGDEEAVGCRHGAWQTRRTLWTVGTWWTRVPTLTCDKTANMN